MAVDGRLMTEPPHSVQPLRLHPTPILSFPCAWQHEGRQHEGWPRGAREQSPCAPCALCAPCTLCTMSPVQHVHLRHVYIPGAPLDR